MIFIAARLRTKHRATPTPQRIPNFADSRAARALLAPRLLSASGNLSATLGLMSAGALTRQILLYGVVKQAFINRPPKDVVGQIQIADHFVLQILDFDCRHITVQTSRQ